MTDNDALAKHIQQIRGFLSVISADNFRDIALHISRQVDEIEAAAVIKGAEGVLVDWSKYPPQETEPGPLRNLYDDHPMMIDSGTFWRCSHGETGFYYACPACGRKHPSKFLEHLEETTVRPPKETE